MIIYSKEIPYIIQKTIKTVKRGVADSLLSRLTAFAFAKVWPSLLAVQ